jgi:hypothetical protein
VGTLLAWKEITFLIILIVLILFTMYNYIFCNAALQNYEISLLDYLSGFFKGMREFSTSDRNQNFNIPIEWFLIQVGHYLIIAKYPRFDFEERGYQFIIRSGSKRNWWYSKCIWVCVNTVVYYGTIYLTIMVAAAFTGNLNLWNVKDIWGLQMNLLSPIQLIITLFVIPVLFAIAFGMLEMFLSFLWNPLVAVIIMLTVCVASAYWDNPLLPGNYSMLLRNKWMFPNYNISMEFGFIYAIIIGFVSAVGGYHYFYRQDIMKKE